jgi:hypothetical protein
MATLLRRDTPPLPPLSCQPCDSPFKAASHECVKMKKWQAKARLKLLIVLKIVHNDQVLGKRAEIPFFAPDRGLTPGRQAINIRTVSTRQAIPP